jgi:pimeloyl-ACP methyl ester carboxylesterase
MSGVRVGDRLTSKGEGMSSTATIPSSDIVFRRDRDGRRALVFVHGFLDDQHVWDPVLAGLSAPGFETVQFDQAGFGDRAGAAGPVTLDRFAADLGAVVDAVGKPFVLVGHSMAGPVVELVAAGRPGRPLGLVLVAPIPTAGARLPAGVIESFKSVSGFLDIRRQAAPSTPEAEFGRIAAAAANTRPDFLQAAADAWNDGHPAGERPSGFTGPVLVLSGADDPLITAEVVASAIAPRFDQASVTLAQMGQSTHWPHVERPAAVAGEIDRFLDKME